MRPEQGDYVPPHIEYDILRDCNVGRCGNCGAVFKIVRQSYRLVEVKPDEPKEP